VVERGPSDLPAAFQRGVDHTFRTGRLGTDPEKAVTSLTADDTHHGPRVRQGQRPAPEVCDLRAVKAAARPIGTVDDPRSARELVVEIHPDEGPAVRPNRADCTGALQSGEVGIARTSRIGASSDGDRPRRTVVVHQERRTVGIVEQIEIPPDVGARLDRRGRH